MCSGSLAASARAACDIPFARAIVAGNLTSANGVPEHYFFDDVDSEVEAAVRVGIELMEANGATVTPIAMPWASQGRAINLSVMLPDRLVPTRCDQYVAMIRAH